MASGTRAPSTIITINLTGQTEFDIPFEYLARKFVIVTLLGVDRKVLTLNTDYRFVSKTRISLANPTPAGYTKLELRRETSATERLVDYHDGSILRAYDLNLSQIQTLHVAEEARDLTADTIGVNDEGHLDARNRKIVNLAYAENGGDAIPLGQVMQWNDSALNSANAAKVSEENAKTSELNAFASEQKAKTSETNAKTSENLADEDARFCADARAKVEEVLPLVPIAEQAAKDAAQSAKEAAQSAIDVKDLGGLPVGSIVMFGTEVVPAGFLSLMAEAPFFNVTEYPDLARLYPSGRLPSYLGRTPEGVSDELAVGVSRGGKVGSAVFNLVTDRQHTDHAHDFVGGTDTQGSHTHNITVEGGWSDGVPSYVSGRPQQAWTNTVGGVIHTSGAHTHTVSGQTNGVHGNYPNAVTHAHIVQGTIGEGKNQVAATGTVFAIKAATGATDDALQVASALSGRVTNNEQEITYIKNRETKRSHYLQRNFATGGDAPWFIESNMVVAFEVGALTSIIPKGEHTDNYYWECSIMVYCPAANVWRHTYKFALAGYIDTNDNGVILIPSACLSHTSQNIGAVYHRITTSEHGSSRIELHLPAGADIRTAYQTGQEFSMVVRVKAVRWDDSSL